MAFLTAVSVDFTISPRIVSIASPTIEVSIQDLYDTLRIIESQISNLSYPSLLKAGGKEVLGGGSSVGITMTLLNAQVSWTDRGSPTRCKISGGNIVAVDANGVPIEEDVFSTNVNSTIAQSASATITDQALQAEVKYRLEALRDSHGSFGSAFYWDPVAGDDLNDGLLPQTARKTFASIQTDLVTDGAYDVIFIVTDNAPPGGITITETLIITKTSLSLRGPGRAVVFVPLDDSADTIVISGANNVEIDSLAVQTGPGPTARNAVAIKNGANDAKISSLWIDNTTGDAVHVDGGDHHLILDIFADGVSGHGVFIDNSIASEIEACRVFNAGGDAFRIMATGGAGSTKHVISKDNLSQNNVGQGHFIGNGVQTTTIRFVNEIGDNITNNGTDTKIERDELIDLVWDEVLTAATHNIPSSAGRRLRQIEAGRVIRANNYQAGSTTSDLILDLGASTTDDFYQFLYIVTVDGPAAGQVRIIVDYDGTTKTASITPDLASAAPNSGDEFEIIALGPAHAVSQAPGYVGGAIWLDTNVLNTNIRNFIDGTADNPVSTIEAAKIIADAVGLANIRLLPDSSITLSEDMLGFVFDGIQYSVDLGGRDISGSSFEGGAITGTGTGTTPEFLKCDMGVVTIPPSTSRECSLSGNITTGAAGDYFFAQCFSAIAGVATPKITFMVGANVNLRSYSGGIQLEAMGATNNMSLEGNGQIIEGTCTGGVVAVRGNFEKSGITNITLVDDARIDRQQIADAILDELLSGHFTADSTGEALNLIRGLVQQNYMIDKTVFDTSGTVPFMTSARFRLFLNKADVDNAIDGATNNEFAAYTVTATKEAGTGIPQLKTYKVTRDP